MDILTSKADGILGIEFNRADKKNAITAAMYQALADVLEDAQDDGAVRVIVLSGKPEVFTAGNDLKDFLDNPPVSDAHPTLRFMRALRAADKPVLAAVAGAAIGIGTTMLLHCDMVYAADDAYFSLPFSQLGLCPEFGSSLLLPRIAGYQRAAEKLLLGEPFTAAEAHAMGLVNQVLPPDQLQLFVHAQAAKLAALPAASLRTTKRLLKGDQEALDRQMAEELQHFSRMLGAPEAKEAFTAFFERRKPDFSRFS
ncbi:MAG: enoyl-CoA hydratase [Noviherbaspirillum sp.]